MAVAAEAESVEAVAFFDGMCAFGTDKEAVTVIDALGVPGSLEGVWEGPFQLPIAYLRLAGTELSTVQPSETTSEFGVVRGIVGLALGADSELGGWVALACSSSSSLSLHLLSDAGGELWSVVEDNVTALQIHNGYLIVASGVSKFYTGIWLWPALPSACFSLPSASNPPPPLLAHTTQDTIRLRTVLDGTVVDTATLRAVSTVLATSSYATATSPASRRRCSKPRVPSAAGRCRGDGVRHCVLPWVHDT